jgi:hypothetical protein
MNSAILAEKCGFVIKDRSEFLHELICELVNDNGTRSSRRPRSLTFDPPLPHYQDKFEKRGNCIVCYNLTKKIATTQYYCKDCSTVSADNIFYLHPQCMETFHSEDFQSSYEEFGKRRNLRARYA